jgi:hypothetical protein
MSDVEYVRPLQDSINKLHSQIIANLANSTNVKVLVPRGSIDTDQVKLDFAKSGAALIEYDAEYGSTAFLRHRPADGDRGDVRGAYCLWRTRGDGDVQWRYMSRAQIEAVRAESPSAGSDFSPWSTPLGYLAMCRKTPIRAALPYLPTSIEMAGAAAADERVHTDLSDDMLADVIDVTEVDEPVVER